jgi:hypothetical protein
VFIESSVAARASRARSSVMARCWARSSAMCARTSWAGSRSPARTAPPHAQLIGATRLSPARSAGPLSSPRSQLGWEELRLVRSADPTPILRHDCVGEADSGLAVFSWHSNAGGQPPGNSQPGCARHVWSQAARPSPQSPYLGPGGAPSGTAAAGPRRSRAPTEALHAPRCRLERRAVSTGT